MNVRKGSLLTWWGFLWRTEQALPAGPKMAWERKERILTLRFLWQLGGDFLVRILCVAVTCIVQISCTFQEKRNHDFLSDCPTVDTQAKREEWDLKVVSSSISTVCTKLIIKLSKYLLLAFLYSFYSSCFLFSLSSLFYIFF